MALWKPWVGETRAVINEYGRYVFAALILGGLTLLNVVLILVVMVLLKHFINA